MATAMKVSCVSSLIIFVIFMFNTTAVTAKNNDTHPNISLFPMPTHVYIQNNLSEGYVLTLHCKSRTEDLGVQYLQYHERYLFRFKRNFFDTTLYFCGFTWRNGRAVRDIYRAKRDKGRCETECLWWAKMDGIHGYNSETYREDIFYPWDPLN